MTPDFVKAVDPIIKMMIDYKEQIEKNASLDPGAISRTFVRRIEESKKLVHQRPDEWNLACYALVAWIDEQLTSSLSWDGNEKWKRNKLQIQLYHSNCAREKFFEEAKKAERLPKKDALEVYFLCVVLGFKGVYDGEQGLQTPQDIGVPETAKDWIRHTRDWIKLNSIKVPEKRSVGVDHECECLLGKTHFVSMLMMFFACAVFAGIVGYLWYSRMNRPAPQTAAVDDCRSVARSYLI